MSVYFILFLTYLQLTSSQQLSWYLILTAPQTVSSGYLYFDSEQQTSEFIKYQNKPDSSGHPMHLTLNQINQQSDINYIAWNDQFPNGSTSSVKAHSKSVIAFSSTTQKGFILSHSIPKFPAFDSANVIPFISDSQRVYGQHAFCMSTTQISIKDILSKASIMRLNIYAQNFKISSTASENLFEYSSFISGNDSIKSIYKNGKKNGSIFEDGLTLMFLSNLLAETWGRPIEQPWCGNQTIPISVGNSQVLLFDSKFTWKRTQDHSKWAIPSLQGIDFSCFGDMNRMESQWKRGGSFFCLKSTKLYYALKNIITETSICESS